MSKSTKTTEYKYSIVSPGNSNKVSKGGNREFKREIRKEASK